MIASKYQIRKWLNEGVDKGATHVVIVCDEMDHSDYPVFIMPGKDPREIASNPGKMHRVMEVYALHLDIDDQLNEHRAFHYDIPKEKGASHGR